MYKEIIKSFLLLIKPIDSIEKQKVGGGYFKPALAGISWMSAFRISSRVISILKVIVLARLLTPAQFGIFGIGSLVLAFLDIITETGINVFLIQEKKDVKAYVNDAWLISIARGVVISFIILLSAKSISLFFNSPDAYLILVLIALVPFIKGFINPSIVTYQKDLEFKKEFYFRLAIFFIDTSVTLIAAFLTKSAVSLVIGMIAGAIFEVLLSFLFINPTPRFSINYINIKKILYRGKWITTYGIFNYLAQEGDNIAVGKIIGSGSLGVYQMGYRLATLPLSEISDVVNKVTFPIFAKIADDRKRLTSAFKKTIITTTLPAVILGIILIILPKDFFTILLGEGWSEVSTIIKILAVYGILRAAASVPSTLFLALQKQNYVAYMTFVRFGILFLTIIPFTYNWGVRGASYSALLSVIAEIPLICYYLWILLKKY